MDGIDKEVNLAALIESCKPTKKRGRPSHKRQLREIRYERKINLQTADSVLAATNLRAILTLEILNSLPVDCQSHLIRLLPDFDQIHREDGSLQARPSALTNEHFSRFCTHYVEKLSDNKLSERAIEKAKSDASKGMAKLDPWKLKNYEPIWGKKLISQIMNVDEGD
uniref:Polycomb protein Asx n=1 Tax=Aceria tosichella TaxID=561515 RepID=A0A6G1SJI6_9ACAR